MTTEELTTAERTVLALLATPHTLAELREIVGDGRVRALASLYNARLIASRRRTVETWEWHRTPKGDKLAEELTL
jgi:predicted DNA-binding ArsR family transcriptional regulator